MAFRCMNSAPANRIDREMNRLLSTFFGESTQPSTSSPSVAVNVWEKDDAWMLEAEMPGVAPEHLEISVVNDELTISVERPETEAGDVTFVRRERARGSFVRTVKLPTSVNADRVEATLVHGVLTLTLPKSEAARRHKIQVNADK